MKIAKQILLQTFAMFVRDDGPKILYYHDVFAAKKYYLHGTPLELFKQHFYWIMANGYVIKDKLPIHDKELMLTFDDGYKGLWDCREFFYEYNLKPTVFIAVDLVGQDRYLSWAEILELQRMGFNFQAHTWTHRRLTEIPHSDLEHELRDARLFLSDKLGEDVDQLCFPQGRFNSEIMELARGYGYRLFYSCIYGNADKRILPDLVCRQLVQEVGVGTLKAILRGGANPFWRRYYKLHYLDCER
jgi:peptidoglycan/xylan/chitin deacetylase (PgdA/CDA1 family)